MEPTGARDVWRGGRKQLLLPQHERAGVNGDVRRQQGCNRSRPPSKLQAFLGLGLGGCHCNVILFPASFPRGKESSS